METIINAAFLIRVSSDGQEFESQIDQLNRIVNLSDENINVNPEHIFQEKISGYTDTRETLELLKKQIEDGIINRVYCIELTRLSRKPQTLINNYEWFNKHQCPIFFVNEDMWTLNPINLTVDENTRQKIYGAALWGEQELKKIKQRTSRGRLLKAKQGYFVGHVAFGFKMAYSTDGNKLIVVNEEEAAIVKEVFEKVANENYTTTQVTKWLNSSDIKTKWANFALNNVNKKTTYKTNNGVKRNKEDVKFTFATVKQILKNKWYIGERTYKEYTLNHEAIISHELFDLANSKLKTNKKIDNAKKTEHVYCLSNLFYCGKCGLTMNAHTTHTSATYYCSSKETGNRCGDTGISKENIEMLLLKIITKLTGENKLFEDKYLTNYFTIEQSGIKVINDKISELSTYNENHTRQNKSIISQITALTVDKSLQQIEAVKQALQSKINELNATFESNNKIISENSASMQMYKEQLNNDFNIADLLTKINTNKDLNQINIIFHKVIQKVTLYNLQSNLALIKVDFKSNKILNIIYQRRNTNFNGKYKDILTNNSVDLYSDTEIEKINTPQTIYYFDNNLIEYNNLTNEFSAKINMYSDLSKFIYYNVDENETKEYIDNQISKGVIHTLVTENEIITTDKLTTLLLPFHSTSYQLFYSKDSAEYKARKLAYFNFTANQREKKAQYKENKAPKKIAPIIALKEYREARKKLYAHKYKVKVSKVMTNEEKETELLTIAAELKVITDNYNLSKM